MFHLRLGIEIRKEVETHKKISRLGLSDPIPSARLQLLKISHAVKMAPPAKTK